jgi:phosphoribosyl-ATP pyrophosphohydrolase/phosphoribosyl-AMP cyclohydrolase
MLDLDALNFEKGQGLLTVVAQDARTGAVLMVAHADRDALERTIRTGEMHYRSRTRGQWHKGATSGNVQRVVSLSADCDGDAVLARVLPAGPACHTGAASCFGTGALYADALSSLDATVLARQQSRAREEPNSETSYSETSYSETSYTRRLLADRNLRLKKLGEESAELVTACADGDASRATQEAADLVYHAIVALHALGASLDDVRAVLAARAARAARAAHPS